MRPGARRRLRPGVEATDDVRDRARRHGQVGRLSGLREPPVRRSAAVNSGAREADEHAGIAIRPHVWSSGAAEVLERAMKRLGLATIIFGIVACFASAAPAQGWGKVSDGSCSCKTRCD